jgi:6-pyruvoyltetrahydropterin/6-carboxytetrahydropterin synthase
MRWEVEKSFTFDAAHRLPLVPEGHKCGRMHGHTYTLVVKLSCSELVDGMVIEYGELGGLVRPIVDEVDHRTLNEVRGLENPTTEILAQWFNARIKKVFARSHEVNGLQRLSRELRLAVTVHESATTKCTYAE